MTIDKIFKIFAPKDAIFYPLLIQDTQNLLKISELVCQLMDTKDSSQWEPIVKQIKEFERSGDHITNQIYHHLDKSFITPFDREDIQKLAGYIDDIADNINRACNRIILFKPKVFMPEFSKLANLIFESAKLIDSGVKELTDIKDIKKLTNICIKIAEVENKADDLYHDAISRLFEKETDPIELIKIKNILEVLERATDKSKTVSNVFQTIIIKRA